MIGCCYCFFIDEASCSVLDQLLTFSKFSFFYLKKIDRLTCSLCFVSKWRRSLADFILSFDKHSWQRTQTGFSTSLMQIYVNPNDKYSSQYFLILRFAVLIDFQFGAPSSESHSSIFRFSNEPEFSQWSIFMGLFENIIITFTVATQSSQHIMFATQIKFTTENTTLVLMP